MAAEADEHFKVQRLADSADHLLEGVVQFDGRARGLQHGEHQRVELVPAGDARKADAGVFAARQQREADGAAQTGQVSLFKRDFVADAGDLGQKLRQFVAFAVRAGLQDERDRPLHVRGVALQCLEDVFR